MSNRIFFRIVTSSYDELTYKTKYTFLMPNATETFAGVYKLNVDDFETSATVTTAGIK